MKRRMIISLFLLFVFFAPATAEISSNVSLSEGWQINYEKGWEGQPVRFHFYNVSGYSAFKITWLVNFYDSGDKYLGRVQGFLPGPIHKYFHPLIKKFPKDTSKMTAEVYCEWQ